MSWLPADLKFAFGGVGGLARFIHQLNRGRQGTNGSGVFRAHAVGERRGAFGNPVEVERNAFVMKFNAIANGGGKKDFWDYAELFGCFSRDEMLGFFAQKYTDENVWYVEKSLSYFGDAEGEPNPRDLKGRCWERIKCTILEINRL
jgi:hypothetical protein